MKFFHLSDLHLGKRLHNRSLLEDQAFILDQILRLVREERPDGVLLAGDIYDKSVPPAEAVRLCDSFLVGLSAAVPHVFLISGNHDCPERLAFGGRLMEREGVHVSPVYNGSLAPVVLADEFGPVHVWLLPFLKPAHVRRFFPEAEIDSYTDALRVVIASLPLDRTARNVLVTHQFVTGAERCESEELCVGGSDNVDAAVFDGFDYVALGHLHGPQQVGRETVRYCGSPLKYSFSEAKQKKSVTVAVLNGKGETRVDTLPLSPLRDLHQLRGTYFDLTAKSYYEHTSLTEDYVRITLTDEEDVPEAMGRLRAIYRNLLQLDYDNTRKRASGELPGGTALTGASPLQLFAQFYEARNGRPMSDVQTDFMDRLIQEVWEEERV